jgi:hypothetical protein
MTTVRMYFLSILFFLASVVCCWAETVPPEEAKNHIGENASVRGLVEQVSFSRKGHVFLNFGGRPGACFHGIHPRSERWRRGRRAVLEILGRESDHHYWQDRALQGATGNCDFVTNADC